MALLPVAFDTGILAVRLLRTELRADENLCPVIIQVARRRANNLLILDRVVREILAIAHREAEDTLLELMIESDAEWCDRATESEIQAHLRSFQAHLGGHEADARVAVEVWKHKPSYFVHCNRKHWSPEIGPALRGVAVTEPREFLEAVGVEKVPKRGVRTRPPGGDR